MCLGPLRAHVRSLTRSAVSGPLLPILACSGSHRLATGCRHWEEVHGNQLQALPHAMPYLRCGASEPRWGRCRIRNDRGLPCCAELSVRMRHDGTLCLGCTEGCSSELPFPMEHFGSLPRALRDAVQRPAGS